VVSEDAAAHRDPGPADVAGVVLGLAVSHDLLAPLDMLATEGTYTTPTERMAMRAHRMGGGRAAARGGVGAEPVAFWTCRLSAGFEYVHRRLMGPLEVRSAGREGGPHDDVESTDSVPHRRAR
jgi:hypothetical protein